MNLGPLDNGAASGVPVVLVGTVILTLEGSHCEPCFAARGAADTAAVDARSVRKRDVNNILENY